MPFLKHDIFVQLCVQHFIFYKISTDRAGLCVIAEFLVC